MKILDVPQSGSVGGVTSSHNRFGQYRRNRRSPVQPTDTARRSTVRQNLTNASAAYSTLTQEQIEAWNTYAQSHPITDVLGSSITLTGHMVFVKINSANLNAGQPVISDPPTDDETFVPSAVVLTLDDTPTITVGFTAVPSGNLLLVAASRPQSAGTRFCKSFRQFAVVAAAGATSALATAYASAYGAPPVGSKVFFRLTPQNTQGVQGTATIVSGVVETA